MAIVNSDESRYMVCVARIRHVMPVNILRHWTDNAGQNQSDCIPNRIIREYITVNSVS